MRKLLVALFLTSTLTACQLFPEKETEPPPPQTGEIPQEKLEPTEPDQYASLKEQLLAVEEKASPEAKKVLSAGRIMTLEKAKIIKGACWDYINAVYNTAGFSDKKRKTVFKGSKNKGPYAAKHLIKPGDWLYYVNHSYHGIEHSAIFVDWVDKKHKKEALMLSYAGGRKKVPARYLSYDLSNVYQIVRAVD